MGILAAASAFCISGSAGANGEFGVGLRLQSARGEGKTETDRKRVA